MLDEIKKEAQALVEKQSWIRKGYHDLLETMNEQVTEIEGDFLVRGTLDEIVDEYYSDVRETYFLTFSGKSDAEFYIQLGIEGYNGLEYKTFALDTLEIAKVRKCVMGMPKAIEEILSKLKKLGEKYQEAIDKVAEMTDKLLS